MNFFDRYATLCKAHGIKPMSEQAAQLIGCTRSAISVWKRDGTTPHSATVAKIAQAFHVTTEYLLGLDDPGIAPPESEHPLLAQYRQLDALDQARVEAYLQGLLAQSKYHTA